MIKQKPRGFPRGFFASPRCVGTARHQSAIFSRSIVRRFRPSANPLGGSRDRRHGCGTHALRSPASVSVRPRARHCERIRALQRLPPRLLLQGLSGLRALPRPCGRVRRDRRHGHRADAARAREADRRHRRRAEPPLLEQSFPLVHRLLPDPDCEYRFQRARRFSAWSIPL